ncbi:hypothetical protein Francci3_0139 [Frankia casuarinae]|uniref:Uncharacterized protein n=1 Tax=Frankia casuarinae (strain DSM 45818 / CECT 9043 / HFP020203 / CcI3) TaxID=106370 RepID=Q2JGQ9_FRACC|nr:hypothetical protein Francci3_0139 [Frankia casuarinae]
MASVSSPGPHARSRLLDAYRNRPPAPDTVRGACRMLGSVGGGWVGGSGAWMVPHGGEQHREGVDLFIGQWGHRPYGAADRRVFVVRFVGRVVRRAGHRGSLTPRRSSRDDRRGVAVAPGGGRRGWFGTVAWHPGVDGYRDRAVFVQITGGARGAGMGCCRYLVAGVVLAGGVPGVGCGVAGVVAARACAVWVWVCPTRV